MAGTGAEAPLGLGAPPAFPLAALGSALSTPPPTTREPPSDVAAQIAALADPRHPKDTVFIARGTEMPRELPPGILSAERREGVLLTTSPEKRRAFMARDLGDDDLGRLLGYPQSKADAIASGKPIAAQARDERGRVLTEALIALDRAGDAKGALAGHVPPGGSLVLLPVAAAQARRLSRP